MSGPCGLQQNEGITSGLEWTPHLRFCCQLYVSGPAPLIPLVGQMEAEPPVKWKSDCLRFGLAPLKAYVIGIPMIAVAWRTNFSEANPHGWDERAANTYPSVLAEIFSRVEYGYLLCAAGLALALFIACWIRDVKAVRAAVGYGMVALLCLVWSYLLSHPPHTR